MDSAKTQNFMYAITNANFIRFIQDTETGYMINHFTQKLVHHGQFKFFFDLSSDRQIKLIEWVENNYDSGFNPKIQVMKLYSALPKTLRFSGIKYNFYSSLPMVKSKPENKRFRTINVLAARLRGKSDLHGNPYKPHKYLFIEA
jgi:hypothetical protein